MQTGVHELNLDEVSRRPLRSVHADCIHELFMGLTWLLWGVLIGLPFLVPRGGWWKPYWIVTPFVLVKGGFVSQRLVSKFKERWSYPRAGYVEFAAPKHGCFLAGLAAALGIALTAARLSIDLAFGALWVGLGVILTIGGGFRLLYFLRHHEPLHG